MEDFIHKILGIDSKPLLYKQFANIEACRRNPEEFHQAPQNRLTSKQRVDFVCKYTNIILQDEVWSQKLRKNSAVASKLREKGNECYKQKDFAKALQWYNAAIMFSPGGNQELGLAYAIRSLALLELGHPDEALEDIELALLNNYPKPAILKKRRKKCVEIIDQRNEIRDDNDEEQKLRIKVEEEMRVRQVILEKMVQIESPNPRIPEAADFVTIRYDEVMGRKLVVTQDVPAGTVLMVSKPYVTVLGNAEIWNSQDGMGWNYSEHCHQCLKRVRRGIPCENCVFAFYCNESCRQEAYEEYHKYECPCMHFLHWLDQSLVVATAFRIVCKAGPEKLFQLCQSQDPAFFDAKEPYGVGEDCKFNEDPYLAVYHMMTHSEKLNEGEGFNVTKTYRAVALALMLESRSTFFHDIPKSRRREFRKFVATLIRHHTDSMIVNPTPVYESRGLEGLSLTDFYTKEPEALKSLSLKIDSSQLAPFALGTYPLDSLKNHSCDPNVLSKDDVRKGRKIMIATRPLKAGDVICGTYNDLTFTNCPLDARQQDLRKYYYFTCQCVACVNDWPTLEQARSAGVLDIVQFCCPSCSVKYSTMEKACAVFKNKCGLNEAGSWRCSSCAKQYSEDTLQLEFNTDKKTFNEAVGLCRLNRTREAIAKVLEAIELFEIYLCPPAYAQTSAQGLLSKALSLFFHSLSEYAS